MNYSNITEGRFIERPNRFIARVEIDGSVQTVHVKNTGRCKELLLPGAKVFLEKSNNTNRKTLYDLISVYKGDTLINMDSQAPNKAAEEWIRSGHLVKGEISVKPETCFGASRLDFYVESEKEKCFVEVKGVTLENNGVASFPDAPTERGRRHLEELIKAKEQGYRAVALFVIQMKGCRCFVPNIDNDPDFADTLKSAQQKGVEVKAVDCIITPQSMVIDKEIEVIL